MSLQAVYIPYGGYWSTPFVKWQGNFAGLHPLTFAAEIARRALQERAISPNVLTSLYLGTTVPAKGSFYGAPWLAGLIGADGITGPTFAQACATSARVLGSAAQAIETEQEADPVILCLATDRTSNGPHLLYPNPLGPGGRGDAEDWVWDNFNRDPLAGNGMIETAENVARAANISTAEQHEVVLMRYNQYQQALANEAAFHQRYLITPIEVKTPPYPPLAKDAQSKGGGKGGVIVTHDEGVFPTTAEGLARLKPVLPGGSVTFGGQTYPADGNAGLLVTTREQARALSRNPAIETQLLAFAEGRAARGYMPQATAPAARRVLERAGLSLAAIKAIKTHNPFAVNDCYLNRELGIPLKGMNNYGCSLIWGHPQGPTGLRLIIELIEELALLGGGYGLFTGCAAGDTAAAIVVKVS